MSCFSRNRKSKKLKKQRKHTKKPDSMPIVPDKAPRKSSSKYREAELVVRKDSPMMEHILPVITTLDEVNKEIVTIIDRLKTTHTKKHLVVDDAKYIRDIIRFYIEDQGVTVEEARNGEDAVNKFESRPIDYYDVVWMDISMPKMDGLEATRLFREKGFRNIIIVLTGNVSRDALLKCKCVGANRICAKPIDEEGIKSMPLFSIYR